MKIVLVGIPGSIPSTLTGKLMDAHPNIVSMGTIEAIFPEDFEFAAGELADYRIELFIAAARAIEHRMQPDEGELYLYENSLLTSAAHAGVRFQRMYESGAVREDLEYTWALVFQLIMSMLGDSFEADRILYVRQGSENPFYNSLNEAYELMFQNFEELKPIIVDSFDLLDDEKADKIVLDLLKEEDGQTDVNSESINEVS